MGGSSLIFVPICDTVKCIKVPVDTGPNDSLSRTSKNKLKKVAWKCILLNGQ